MYGFDANSGQIRWSVDAATDGATQFHGYPVITDSLLIFGTDQGSEFQGSLYAVNRMTGAVVWKRDWNSTGLPSDIISDDSLIYLVTQTDALHAIRIADGSTKWFVSSTWSRSDSGVVAGEAFINRLKTDPVLAGDLVIFPGRDNSIYALDKLTGSHVWTRGMASEMSTQLLLDGSRLVVGTFDATLVGLTVTSGDIEFTFEVSLIPVETMARKDDTYVMLAGDNPQWATELMVIDRESGTFRWAQTNPDVGDDAYWYVPRIHQWHDGIVVGSSKGMVVSYASADGSIQWTHHLDGAIRGIGHSADRLFVGTFQGLLLALQR